MPSGSRAGVVRWRRRAPLSPPPRRSGRTAEGRRWRRLRVVPIEVLPDSIRRYDHHRRRLLLSERLAAPGRSFAIAYQLALAEHDGELAAMVERAAPPDGPTARLLKVSLANYLAAATMMPYEAFRQACE